MNKIAIIIPCLNEGQTIKEVIEKLKQDVPEGAIYVCDNNSSDDTVKNAIGANILHQPIKGKGNCIRYALSNVEAEYFVIVDGDLTYDTKDIIDLISLMKSQRFDMINVKRISKDKHTYKFGRKIGNILYNKLFKTLFNSNCEDVLSGYKILNKKFVDSISLKSEDFEIETELHIQACKKQAKVVEMSCSYYSRPKNSKSKLHFFNDALRILEFLFKEYFNTNSVK